MHFGRNHPGAKREWVCERIIAYRDQILQSETATCDLVSVGYRGTWCPIEL